MKNILAVAAATAALAVSAPVTAQSSDERSDEAFNELVEGRTAGEPRSCISVMNSNRLRVIEHVGLAYQRGNTLWVARARDPDSLGPWDVPIIQRYNSNLCRHDVVRTIDRSTGIFSGIVSLEDFVPYVRDEDA